MTDGVGKERPNVDAVKRRQLLAHVSYEKT